MKNTILISPALASPPKALSSNQTNNFLHQVLDKEDLYFDNAKETPSQHNGFTQAQEVHNFKGSIDDLGDPDEIKNPEGLEFEDIILDAEISDELAKKLAERRGSFIAKSDIPTKNPLFDNSIGMNLPDSAAMGNGDILLNKKGGVQEILGAAANALSQIGPAFDVTAQSAHSSEVTLDGQAAMASPTMMSSSATAMADDLQPSQLPLTTFSSELDEPENIGEVVVFQDPQMMTSDPLENNSTSAPLLQRSDTPSDQRVDIRSWADDHDQLSLESKEIPGATRKEKFIGLAPSMSTQESRLGSTGVSSSLSSSFHFDQTVKNPALSAMESAMRTAHFGDLLQEMSHSIQRMNVGRNNMMMEFQSDVLPETHVTITSQAGRLEVAFNTASQMSSAMIEANKVALQHGLAQVSGGQYIDIKSHLSSESRQSPSQQFEDRDSEASYQGSAFSGNESPSEREQRPTR